MTDVLKSKYEVKSLIFEDLISFCYEGKTHYSEHSILIWKYKSNYLSSALVTRLINVSEKLIAFNNPHVLKMLDYYYDGESFYTIHEGVSNYVTFESYIQQSNKVDLKRRWVYATQLLNMFLQLEQSKLYCGTLNFSNLLITDGGQLKLSRLMIPVEIFKGCLSEFSVVEECIFFAPEFILNQSYSRVSDIYGFGILLYVLFSQKWPFKYALRLDELKKEVIKGPEAFEPIHPKVPDQLGRLISVCLNPDPELRFSTFSELVQVYRGDMDFSMELPVEGSNLQKKLKDDLQLRALSNLKEFVKWGCIAACMILMGFGVNRLYVSYLTSIPEVAVPNVLGIHFDEAESMLEQYQLRSLVVGARFHPHYEEGDIIDMKPPAGRVVKEDRVIRLFVSKGAGPILVPDLIGYTHHNSQELLTERGLLTEVIGEAYSLQYPEGTIIAQIPESNHFVGPSENVKLTLSKGYPVEVSIKKAKPSFFLDKSHLRQVIVEFFILDEWPTQDVAIYYQLGEDRQKIFSDLVKSGQNLKVEFELDYEGTLEVYFNNDLTVKQSIVDEIKDVSQHTF